jgi:hypothetical protein
MLLKSMLVGLVLGLVKEETINAVAITVIYLLDFIIIVFVRPMVSAWLGLPMCIFATLCSRIQLSRLSSQRLCMQECWHVHMCMYKWEVRQPAHQ